METTRKSNKNYPFEGLNPYSVWSVNDSLEQLLEIKKILQEKSKKRWLIFYLTTVALLLLSFLLYKSFKELIVFIVCISFFMYILYVQTNRLKILKYQELDLDSRIKQVEEKESKMQQIPGNKNFAEIIQNNFRCKKCYPAVSQKILTGLSSDDKLELWCDNCKTGVFLYLLENQKNNEYEK